MLRPVALLDVVDRRVVYLQGVWDGDRLLVVPEPPGTRRHHDPPLRRHPGARPARTCRGQSVLGVK